MDMKDFAIDIENRVHEIEEKQDEVARHESI